MRHAILGGIVVLTAVSILSLLPGQEPPRPPAPRIQEWEYFTAAKSSVVRREGRPSLVVGVSSEKLNEFGADGWQLCETFGDYLVFKRPKPLRGAGDKQPASSEETLRGTVTFDGDAL